MDLVGCLKDADLVLVLETGEIIFAHSKYLKRNPYFKAHLNFNAESEKLTVGNSRFNIIKVLPPHLCAFRTILQLIYFHGDNVSDYEYSISVEMFCALMENALFFQMDLLVDACKSFFNVNWKLVSLQGRFCKERFSDTTLIMLFETWEPNPNADSYIFECIIKYRNNSDSEDARFFKALMEENVSLGSVDSDVLDEMNNSFHDSFNDCLSASDILGNLYEKTAVLCSNCDEWISLRDLTAKEKTCLGGSIHKPQVAI
ncbi:hypothetical protein BCR33DRAFT_748818 [Rhizoclosmatium globosum]|uniref:BTB domain-containing protein n=1 Tax=Rhizoclosmatium globosum TaxID=329046 RepID=A0A1Y2AJK2_9FUNG|nr:hypothetical protein BCR33DRAFT_748818 [Rhizoclosmatium globosum]|eukprot:ORY22749.1 hypothetical protein BCR33DRAFT_748818 [Rhizoclosmatium globosum]